MYEIAYAPAVYALPVFLGALAFLTKSLNVKGTACAMIFAYVIILTQAPWWLASFLAFFVICSLATRLHSIKKKKLGLYQKQRGLSNVFSNGVIATISAFSGSFYGFFGALSTATADTLSSELGILSKKHPRLITSLKQVKTGTNGGISLLGNTVTVLGALFIAAFAYIIIPSEKTILIITTSGVFGSLFDSLVGAVWENKKIVNGWQTNLIATAAGAGLSIALSNIL